MVKRRADDEAFQAFVEDFASRLADAIGSRSLRSVARAAGVAHSTLTRLLAGETTPTFEVLWRLESELDAELWPGSHRRTRRASRSKRV